MTVKELKDKLARLPDDMEVVMSSDAEGNKISPLAASAVVVYTPYNTWSRNSGEVAQDDEETFQDYALDGMTREEWDAKARTLCLWPV